MKHRNAIRTRSLQGVLGKRHVEPRPVRLPSTHKVRDLSPGPLSVLTQSLNIVLSEKERRGLDLYARTYPKVTFINVSPDIGTFSYLNRLNARSLVMRGYREALRELAAAKDRGVFDPRPDLKLVG